MISIIVPLYNKEKYINKTIDSIISQVYQDFELIIVDDGSTDDSISIIKSISDSRIKFYSKKNGGVSSARNYGISKASGEYLFFIDADDIIYPNCLDVLIKTSLLYPKASLILGNYITRDSTNDTNSVFNYNCEGYIKNPFKSIWKNNISPRAGALLIKTDKIKNKLYFDERINVFEDMQFWMCLIHSNVVAYSTTIIHEYLRDNSELSIKQGPLEKEFSYYINLKKIKNKYEKKILVNILYGSIASRIHTKDLTSVMTLLNKNITMLHWLIWIGIYRKLLRYKIINNKTQSS